MNDDLLPEIAYLIAHAAAGDGDQVLNILEMLHAKLVELEQRIERIEAQ